MSVILIYFIKSISILSAYSAHHPCPHYVASQLPSTFVYTPHPPTSPYPSSSPNSLLHSLTEWPASTPPQGSLVPLVPNSVSDSVAHSGTSIPIWRLSHTRIRCKTVNQKSIFLTIYFLNMVLQLGSCIELHFA